MADDDWCPTRNPNVERNWSGTNGGIAEKQNAAMYEAEARARAARGEKPTKRDNDTMKGEPPGWFAAICDLFFDL